jgi:ubiquitin C-terminal hydrolase
MEYNRNYFIKKNESIYLNSGKNLFKNEGNYCYFNSILQCLFNCIELTDYFISNDYLDDAHSDAITIRIYNSLLSNYWMDNAAINPKRLLMNISSNTYNYNNNEQEDSHECLLRILECLHGGLDYKIKINIQGEPSNNVDKLTLMYLDAYKSHYENSFSRIKQMFYGMFINTFECTKCNSKEYKFEPFSNITLNIYDNLNDSLSNLFLQEKIDYKCEKCKNKSSTKDSRVWSFPNNLIFHFNKFDDTNIKKTECTQFPLDDLNLTSYISKLNGDTNNYIYDLYSVNFHKGNKNTGHFYSACRDVSGNWIMYDDNSVTRIHKEAVLQTVIHSDAYILFYRRKFIKK